MTWPWRGRGLVDRCSRGWFTGPWWTGAEGVRGFWSTPLVEDPMAERGRWSLVTGADRAAAPPDSLGGASPENDLARTTERRLWCCLDWKREEIGMVLIKESLASIGRRGCLATAERGRRARALADEGVGAPVSCSWGPPGVTWWRWQRFSANNGVRAWERTGSGAKWSAKVRFWTFIEEVRQQKPGTERRVHRPW